MLVRIKPLCIIWTSCLYFSLCRFLPSHFLTISGWITAQLLHYSMADPKNLRMYHRWGKEASCLVNALFRVLFRPRDVSSMEFLQRLPLFCMQQDVRPPLPHELHSLLGRPSVINMWNNQQIIMDRLIIVYFKSYWWNLSKSHPFFCMR